mgnify:CR=1 FL=1
MLFRKKKSDPKPFCLHEWQLADYKMVDSYKGYDVDILHKYELGCEKCQSLRTVDNYEYSQMVNLGLIK